MNGLKLLVKVTDLVRDAATLPADHEQQTDGQWKDNCDLKGQDLQENTSNNPALKNTIQECGKACFDDTKCDHFTWMSVDKKCNMKIQWDGNNPTDLANAKCGYVESPYVLEKAINCCDPFT